MNIIIFLVILLVLVLFHEMGHFLSAKFFKIKVEEFGFGFPPRLFSKKYGETEYSINALPIGGFVKILGENGEDEEESSNKNDTKRSFVNKPKWQQAIVLLAGIFANFLLAWILFSIGFMSGLPTSLSNEPKGYTATDVHLTVVSVLANSPAQNAGLKPGDKIISIATDQDSVNFINPESLRNFVLNNSEKEIQLGYLRGKDEKINLIKVIPSKNILDGKPGIGISMDEVGTLKLPFFKALKEGLVLDWSVTKETVLGIYRLVKDGVEGKGNLSSVTGPVGMVGIVGNAYQFGFVYLLSFAGLISVNLAIINLIPFPALDGGRLLFLLIEKIKGSRLNPKFANTANMIGFAVLIILMFFVTYHDVTRLF